jgi:hypothetical protein
MSGSNQFQRAEGGALFALFVWGYAASDGVDHNATQSCFFTIL